MKVAFAQKDAGGILWHTMVDTPSDGDRWSTSAPTVRLLTATGGVMQSSVSTAVGPSMTLASTIDAAGTSVVLSTVTGITRWSEYVIGPNASGQWEWVTVDGIGTSSVSLVEGTTYAYSTGHAFKSHDLSYTVTSSIAASLASNCRAEWTYYVDAVKRVENTIFHVSLYSPRIPLTSAEFVQEYPRAKRVIGSNQRVGILLRRLWERHVLADISRVFRPGAMVSGEAAERALVAKAKEYIENEAKNYEAADRYVEEYTAALDIIKESLVDLDESGGVDDDEVVRSIRTPRILRG